MQRNQPCHLLRLLAPCVTALSLSACDGDTLGHFDADEDLPEIRIEGSPVSAALPSFFPPLPLDVQSSDSFKDQEYDYLSSIQLEALTLQISGSSTDPNEDTLEDGQADNFNFLSGASIHIAAQFDGGRRSELIGSIAEDDPQLSSSSTVLELNMTGIDILRFVEAPGGYQIEIQASGEAPPDAVIFSGLVEYRVGVGFK